MLCIIMIGMMVAVGGYTRLSGSGLSITEWKPIHGTIPPLNAAQWQEEFDKYRAIPQYKQLNLGMSLDEFKGIYWPEYWHRNLGRLIGMVYALPMFFFMFRKAFIGWFNVRMLIILGLGGLQGLIGWIMVASGLQDRLYVHHLKLALHFGTAMLLAAAVFWAWLGVKNSTSSALPEAAPPPSSSPPPSPSSPPLGAGRALLLITLLIFAQLIMGALVAGLHAGLIYNSFPTMNGDWIAPDVFTYDGSWFDHVPMVQFVHRWMAKLIVALAIVWWFVYYRSALSPSQRGLGASIEQKDLALSRDNSVPKAWRCFVLVLFAQFMLGILTLINAAPLHWALLHQIGGFLLLLAALNLYFQLKLRQNISVQHG